MSEKSSTQSVTSELEGDTPRIVIREIPLDVLPPPLGTATAADEWVYRLVPLKTRTGSRVTARLLFLLRRLFRR